MKLQSVQGYLLATAFLNIYKEENEIVGKLKGIHIFLQQLSMTYMRKGLNINKQLDIIWKKFEQLTNNDERNVSLLTFVFQLIVKNPNKNKYKVLTNLAFELSKEKRFSKEESELEAKKLVNKFYGLSNDTK